MYLSIVASVAIALATMPNAATAGVIGSLGNFDVVNDTGQTAYGFEIELEGVHESEVTDVFGGPGRGFPTGRGFDPSTSVERYGSPSITEYTNGSVYGTKVTYYALWDGTSWDYSTPTTPSPDFFTPGDNCWSGGGLPGKGYDSSCPCDHFGVGTSVNPTKTTYSWLHEVPGSPGTVTTSTGLVQLPVPVWEVIPPDPGLPPGPPQVGATIEAWDLPPDAPLSWEFGDAYWVKVFTTEVEHQLELEDLLADAQHVEEAETEVEWQLLQKDVNNPDSGKLESGYGAPVGPNAASILRRYEFYAFSGDYDEETHEALFQDPWGDSNPNPDYDIGTYLGSQNAAANIVPEPHACALLLAGLVAIGAAARSRRVRVH
jgi:hypothetical protein